MNKRKSISKTQIILFVIMGMFLVLTVCIIRQYEERKAIKSRGSQIQRYEELKALYYPPEYPQGIYVFGEEYIAHTLEEHTADWDMCAVIEVEKGVESQLKQKLVQEYIQKFGVTEGEELSEEQVLRLLQEEPGLVWRAKPDKMTVKVEEYLFDHTEQYLNELVLVPTKKNVAWWDWGTLSACKGMRLIVFLNVKEKGVCEVDLRWNFFITEDNCLVPATEQYMGYRTGNENYVAMKDYGGTDLESYQEEVKEYAAKANKERVIYEYLNTKLTADKGKITSACEILKEERKWKKERVYLTAFVEEYWIDEALQQESGIGYLELKRNGVEYTVVGEKMGWEEENVRLPEGIREQAEELGYLSEDWVQAMEGRARSNLESWELKIKREQKIQKMYEAAPETGKSGVLQSCLDKSG